VLVRGTVEANVLEVTQPRRGLVAANHVAMRRGRGR
jgi:hypothetical protein